MSQSIILEDSGMSGFTIGDLGVFIGTLGGVITSILIVLQKSKCKKINCCCMSCEREGVNQPEPPQAEEPPNEQAPEDPPQEERPNQQRPLNPIEILEQVQNNP